ncbi:uncharacterized protein LOC122867136 isoform X1 [Xyrichtys novacula]|uniref:Uncharacterized protein LOC122867136 isoform X1 n=1 Tax=Xyrichtys novacula TaxID=13765 RepID=A0AAV1H6L5_XYRNO|nr:uncharacterized protein LOC122867136 isoform X1 [Xyrichtys novacula]
MENHQVLLESFNRTQNMELNTGVSVFPQQNITQPEIIQGTEPDLTVLALTEFRIQQLENRQFLLQEMLHITEKSKDNNNRPTEEMTSEDCDKLCELEIIQKELEELEMKKKELQKQETGSELGFNSEVTSEDCDKLCELEIIQKELEELGMKKEELQKQETGSELGFNSEAFEMDTLPSLQEMNEDVKESQEGKVEPTSEDTRGPVIPGKLHFIEIRWTLL